MKKTFLSIVSILTFTFSFGQTQQQLDILDKYYQKALEEWHIPGMAVAITDGEKILFSKGYGYANIDKKKKVDGNTLFAVASNSKAFTATAIAQLIEQKKLNWNDKAIKHLPYYKLYNDYTTQNETIEDLLCHRNGLETFSGDLLWYGTTKNAEEIIAAQHYLKPTSAFRTRFGYSNISFLAAGKILEKATDTTWSTYISTHFLKPLKMNRTLTSTNQIKNTKNVATPYFYEDGKHYEIAWLNWDNIAPAGALISSVNDYAKWLQLNLNKGTLNGKKYFSKASFNQLTTPHINFPVRKNNEKTHFKGYGLGWSLQDYQGYKVIGHSGGYDGMISKSAFVPEKNLGIIIVTNSLSWAPSALVNKSFDVLLANIVDGKDWSSYYLSFKEKQNKSAKEKLQKTEKERGKFKNQLPNSEYIGTYTDKMYGDVIVSETNGKLQFEMVATPIFKANLKHWNHTIFTFRFDKNLVSLPQGKLWFDLDQNGKTEKLHINIPNPDFYFEEFEFIKKN